MGIKLKYKKGDWVKILKKDHYFHGKVDDFITWSESRTPVMIHEVNPRGDVLVLSINRENIWYLKQDEVIPVDIKLPKPWSISYEKT